MQSRQRVGGQRTKVWSELVDSTLTLRFSEIKTPETTVFPDEDRTEGAAERPGGSQVTTVGQGKEVRAPPQSAASGSTCNKWS